MSSAQNMDSAVFISSLKLVIEIGMEFRAGPLFILRKKVFFSFIYYRFLIGSSQK